ncbi:MAG: S-methyl-5-thioribose-1-phosphate isomerase [Candidatus Odinarchaeota archaeon]|nr:S-methyl-5-thioribose-1-phosphate isomerase [Candidatus Odinarchaeota archaeon]
MALRIRSIEWKENKVIIVNQLKLPTEIEYIECTTPERVVEAIKNMEIRGAPAIGAAAAYALALAAIRSNARSRKEFLKEIYEVAEKLKSTRPTAINLFWAINRVLKSAEKAGESIEKIVMTIVNEAKKIAEKDIKANKLIGKYGAKLIEDGDCILTHCNTGSLATVDYGTALGIIRAAVEEGKKIHVYVTETRPKLQGARLTALELKYENIPVTVICDNMVGYIMQKELVNKVFVGADRILRTGHVINKIGTYTIAVLAKYHNVPFYVAAPTSTFDLKKALDQIEIEERSPEEVAFCGNIRVVPKGVNILNPAFDVTPPQLITAIITEKGILEPPLDHAITKIFNF